jgi:hypothetical protein
MNRRGQKSTYIQGANIILLDEMSDAPVD